MQGKKENQEKLFVCYRLSDHIAKDNPYVRLKELIDFRFLYEQTVQYYGKVGPPSIDPVVFMKLMLFGYMENLNSDRAIIRQAALRMDLRYFIGYDIDEALPWHSTLSRTRQLYGQDVFMALFKKVMKHCVDLEMIAGSRQSIDGFFIKANASMESVIDKEILEDAETYGRELAANEEQQQPGALKIEQRTQQEVKQPQPRQAFKEVIACDATTSGHQQTGPSPLYAAVVNETEGTDSKSKKEFSNDTRYSPSDPDAKMSVKPGKVTALNYLGQVSVDTATHVITHVQVFTAEKRDCECLAAVVMQVKNTLLENGIALQEIVADTGYSSGNALRALDAQCITGYIPNRGSFHYERDGFTYHKEGDYYQCQNGKHLTYRNIQSGRYPMNIYRINRKECVGCPFQTQCSAYNKKDIIIRETEDKPYYDRMHIRMQTNKASIMMRLRQSTVEPVIGTLVNFLGIKRVNAKGLEQANKCLTMAAIAYNLNKILRHKPKATPNHGKSTQNSIKRLLNALMYLTNQLYCTLKGYPRLAF